MFESILRAPDFLGAKCTGRELVGTDQIRQEDVTIVTKEEENSLNIYITAEQTELELVRLRWNLKERLKGRVLGDAWERGYGDLRWEGMVPHRAMPWYFLVRREGVTAGYGVKVRPGALCFWQADPGGISLWLDVRNGGAGVRLGGRTLLAATVVFETYTEENAFHAARLFCKRMCQDPIFPPNPVYGANNWYYAYGHSSYEEILEDTRYLARLTKGLENRPYMVIDDCWQKNRREDYIGGPWVPNEKFSDMKALAENIREQSCIPGIWVRFLLDEREEIPKECRLSHNGCLDPSHPGVLAQIREDITRICGWGYRLIKHDFSTQDIFGKWGFQMNPFMTEAGWHFYDRSKTSAEIVVQLYETILESATPTGTLILGCDTIGHLGAGLMHMNRTGDDTSGVCWERTLRMGVNTLAFRMPHHRTFYDVDADCLGITEHIPWKYNRLWGKALAKSGTPLFVSAKPGVLKESEEQELAGFLREASRQETVAEPLDWEETTLPEDWKIQECRRHSCCEPHVSVADIVPLCGSAISTGVEHYDWYEETGLRVVGEHGVTWENLENETYF
jgi:alpha-galactosidase